MNRPTRAFLYYLRQYLKAKPEQSAELRKYHLAKTRRKLDRPLLWRHCRLRCQPNMETTLCYLSFLHSVGELIPAKRGNGPFYYKHREWLRK